jgi:hypothetical protein
MKEFKRSSYAPGQSRYETNGFVFKNTGPFYSPTWACEELGITFAFGSFGNGNDAKMLADVATTAVLHDRKVRAAALTAPF